MQASTNGFDPSVVVSLVERIERHQAELKAHTQEVREEIADIFTEAVNDAGIPKRVLRMVLRERALTAKIEALNEPDSDVYEQLTAALGHLDGTPLGEATRRAVRKDQAPASRL